jgi:hypothetical protein
MFPHQSYSEAKEADIDKYSYICYSMIVNSHQRTMIYPPLRLFPGETRETALM